MSADSILKTMAAVLLLSLAIGSYKLLEGIGYYYRNAYADSCIKTEIAWKP